MKRLYVLAILLLNLVLLAWAPHTTAQPTPTTFQRFSLLEYGLFARTGMLNLYTWNGNPFGFANLGAVYHVDPVCAPGGFGSGIFLSEGGAFGYLLDITFWPFPFGTTSGFCSPLDICDPDAAVAAWFPYGDSLNLGFPRGDTFVLTGDESNRQIAQLNSVFTPMNRSFVGVDNQIGENSFEFCVPPFDCSAQLKSREGVFFMGFFDTARQFAVAGCPGGDTGPTPFWVGNTLICAFAPGQTWLDPAGNLNSGLFPFFACEWYYTCSEQPVTGVVQTNTCFTGGGGGGGTGTVGVQVLNGSTRNPVAGATVSFPGGPTQTTDANGNTTFTNVPAGAPVTFTASASGFAAGSATVTPVANATTPLTILVAPVVVCNTSQVAGGDTPDTRFVDLKATSGRFVFDYETFGQKDRIIVSYQGGTLFDTGCVGTNGTRSQTLNYSGSDTGVTVEVQPNCEGGSGTAWNYFAHCPQ